MIFFKRKKKPSPAIVPKKELAIKPVQEERVLTAEGWRRRVEAKITQLTLAPAKKVKKAK